MPELQIIFTGLCAAGPPGPQAGNGELEADGPYQVIMPASRPRPSRHDAMYTIPVHLPFIAVRSADLVAPYDPKRRLESLILKSRTQEELYVWLLSREHVTFLVDGAEIAEHKVQYIQSTRTPEQAPLQGNTERDVNWIPDMRLIWPEAATVRSECVPPGKDPSVAVQVTINGGTLSSRFPFDIARSERITTFEPVKAQPVKQVITRQSLFAVPLPDRGRLLTIRSSSIDSSTVELAPIEIEIPQNRPLTIFVGNTDLQDLINTVTGNLTDNEYDFDADFELYYDILNVPAERSESRTERPVLPPLPIPISDPDHGGHSDCPKLRVVLPGGTS